MKKHNHVLLSFFFRGVPSFFFLLLLNYFYCAKYDDERQTKKANKIILSFVFIAYVNVFITICLTKHSKLKTSIT